MLLFKTGSLSYHHLMFFIDDYSMLCSRLIIGFKMKSVTGSPQKKSLTHYFENLAMIVKDVRTCGRYACFGEILHSSYRFLCASMPTICPDNDQLCAYIYLTLSSMRWLSYYYHRWNFWNERIRFNVIQHLFWSRPRWYWRKNGLVYLTATLYLWYPPVFLNVQQFERFTSFVEKVEVLLLSTEPGKVWCHIS